MVAHRVAGLIAVLIGVATIFVAGVLLHGVKEAGEKFAGVAPLISPVVILTVPPDCSIPLYRTPAFDRWRRWRSGWDRCCHGCTAHSLSLIVELLANRRSYHGHYHGCHKR